MKVRLIVPSLWLCSGLLACSQAVPKELVDARTAYDRAAHGPASQLTPAELHTASTQLAEAEKAFDEDGDSARTRDLAYVAERRAQIAEVKARTALANQRAEKARADAERAEAQKLQRTQSELDSARDQLKTGQAQLSEERARRAEAEQRAQRALDDLARVASIKEEARGMVITLSGSVLFESGKAQLLPSAEARLTQVSEALATTAPDQKIVVEGHTDSQGSAAFNAKLSLQRAEAVRGYLITHGVAADRVQAMGVGPDRPVADNKSPEGRANNRRVEIIVQPSATATGGEPSAPQAAAPGAK